MIQWNYRVFREPDGDYVIREVFYAEDGSIVGCGQNEALPTGRSLAELTEDIEALASALTKPVLTLADIPKGDRTPSEQRSRHSTISHDRVLAELGLERLETPRAEEA